VTELATEAALNAALAAAQGEFQPIPRDKTVTVRTRSGDSYTFSYAPLDTILAACRPILSKHGLALVQQLEHNGQPSIRTELRHAEGGVIGASFPLPHMPDRPQELGSLITYLRRYAIVALLGVAAEEDDDAQQAAEPAKGPPERQARPDVTMELASDAQTKNVWRLMGAAEKQEIATKDQLREQMGGMYGTENPAELTRAQAREAITNLKVLVGED
jgi:ERF superfamily